MAGQDSEEKNLPASKKKLRDTRQKGQVAKSKDLVIGVALAGGLAYLLFAAGTVGQASAGLFEKAAELGSGDFHEGLAAIAPALAHAATVSLVPLFVLVPGLVVVTSMVALQGIPFAIDPIVPKAEKINPAEGFKKLFQLRSFIELVKSLAKTVLIVCVLVAILAGGLRALVYAPSCGLGCEIGVFRSLAIPVLASAAVLFLVAGGIDLALQRWLFLRDQKMSVSEMKRERKDMDGDPHVKAHRKRVLREALRLAGGLGIKRATVLIHDGGAAAVGLRFKMNEMPAPVVVCRGRDSRAASMLTEAADAALPLTEDAELAAALLRVPLGHGIPEALFRPVALALRRAGAV